MVILVIYDICETNRRNRIVKESKNTGLYRIQKSVFMGEIDSGKLKDLVDFIGKETDGDEDSVYLVPVCNADYRKIIIVGQSFNRELVSGEASAVFF